MFWEKKKKESGLPNLPKPSPIINRDKSQTQTSASLSNDLKVDMHELPSFPDSPMQKGFSQSAIKDAITSEEIEKEHELNFITESDNWILKNKISYNPTQKPKDDKPIFVRIDKYQIARSSLETVKQKFIEIEDLLKQIRDVKAKEDVELSSWEADMENIKLRIDTVVKEIFDKIE